MKDWELFEQLLKKPLEEVVSLVTLDWKKGVCKDKRKFFDKNVLLEALKEKGRNKK